MGFTDSSQIVTLPALYPFEMPGFSKLAAYKGTIVGQNGEVFFTNYFRKELARLIPEKWDADYCPQ